MANNLARIYGTEEDRVNCPFYYKVGACQHGDRCSRTHNKPHFSQSLIIPHMYTLPPVNLVTGELLVDEREHLRDFCEEVIEELEEFGDLEEFNVTANLREHLLGNVYLKYHKEEEADRAFRALNGRWYGGRQLKVEFSPVSDIRESRCRKFDEDACDRGAFCNFLHLRPLPSSVRRQLDKIRDRAYRRRRDRARSRSRSRSRDGSRTRGNGGRESERRSERDGYQRGSRQRDELPAAASSSSGGDHHSHHHRGPRSVSEERRAKIAQWNRERTARKAAEAAAAAAATTTSSAQPDAHTAMSDESKEPAPSSGTS